MHLGKREFVEFVDHPIDHQLDYNELVDDLEEEHLKRDVFTTDKGLCQDDDELESGAAQSLLDSKSLTSRGQPRRAQKSKQPPSLKRQRLQ